MLKPESPIPGVTDLGKIKYRYFHWGPYVFESAVTQAECNVLIEEGKKWRKKPYDHGSKLAGHLSEQYKIHNLNTIIPWFKTYVMAYVQSYYKWRFPQGLEKRANPTFVLESLWINYMKANEFNPPHGHGGDFSFVIYPHVPEEITQENQNFKGTGLGPGGIAFEYGGGDDLYISAVHCMPATGSLFIFPAKLKHWVFPFRSDVERISVSGNIFLGDPDKDKEKLKRKEYSEAMEEIK